MIFAQEIFGTVRAGMPWVTRTVEWACGRGCRFEWTFRHEWQCQLTSGARQRPHRL